MKLLAASNNMTGFKILGQMCIVQTYSL